MNEDATVSKGAVASFLIILADAQLILDLVAGSEVSRTTDWTLFMAKTQISYTKTPVNLFIRT